MQIDGKEIIERIHESELETRTNSLHIEQIIAEMTSHFHNQKQRDEKIFKKLEEMPDEDRMVRLFAREGEKLAQGLIKKDDEQQKQLDELHDKYSTLDKRTSTSTLGWKIGFAIMASYVSIKEWLIR